MLDIAYRMGAQRALEEAQLSKEGMWQAPLIGAFADTAFTNVSDPNYSGKATTPILRGALTGAGMSLGWSMGRNPLEKMLLAGISGVGSRALANYLDKRG